MIGDGASELDMMRDGIGKEKPSNFGEFSL